MTLRPLAALVLFASLSAPSLARAQSEGDKATARDLGQQGQQALDSNDPKQAEDRFRRADALFHAPTLALGLARAQARQGKVVEAWENYHRVILENVTSPPAFAKALQEAMAEIPLVEARRARLTVSVTGPDAPRVRVNDVPLRNESLGVARFVDPGHLVVTVTADGFKPATKAIDVAEGREATLALALEKDHAAGVVPAVVAVPEAVQPAPAPQVTPPAQPAQPSASSGGSVQKPIGIAALSLGGAGLVLGAVTGGLAMSKHSSLNNECPGGACSSSSSQSDLSSYHTMAGLSTAGFIIAGAGIASGLVLLLTAPKSDAAPSAPSAIVRPFIGPGSIGAVGTF